jgi:hypothetical protein
MPQIIVEYTESFRSQVADWFEESIEQELRRHCAELFSVKEWRLKPDDFSFDFRSIKPPSSSTDDVVIRIALHNFEERVAKMEEHAETIKLVVAWVVKRANPGGWITWPTVGVSLSYMPIAWSSGSVYYG